MKNPDPSKEARAGEAVGNFPSGKSDITSKSSAPSSASNVIAYPRARIEQPANARSAFEQWMSALEMCHEYIRDGGSISDAEYKRLASVAEMARAAYDPFLYGGAA